jgi:mRNA interferase RelE/StbE
VNTEFKKSFAKDLKKRSQDKNLLQQVTQTIQDVETAQSLQDIKNLKKLKAGENSFRIRIGDYRLGLIIENDTACFVRLLSRKEIYRNFP